MRREVVRTQAESEQDNDDGVLAQRLEFFTKSLSGTRASINRKPRAEHDLLKGHPTLADVATSCEEAKEIATNSPRKGAARKSLSGLGALATPHDDDDDDQGLESNPGSSLEDTCRSPRTVCEDHSSDGDDVVDEHERSCQVELTNSAPQAETVTLVRVTCTLSNGPALEDVDQFVVGDDNMSVGLMESEDHTAVENEADNERPNAHKEADTAGRQDFLRLELPTSPPPELLNG